MSKIIGNWSPLIVGLLCVVGFYWWLNTTSTKTIQQQATVIAELRDSVRYFKNREGQLVAHKAAAEANLEVLKSAYSEDFKYIKEKLDINAKDVKGIYKAVTKTSGRGEGGVDTVYIPVPTGGFVPALSVYDSTKWFSISGTVTPGKFDYKYTVYDHITLSPYKEGKKLYVRGTSENPNTKITGLTGILVSTEERNKPWGIGPSIQLGYDTEFRLTPGVSLQYSLIRF